MPDISANDIFNLLTLNEKKLFPLFQAEQIWAEPKFVCDVWLFHCRNAKFGDVICDNLCIICDTDDIKRQCDHLHDLNGTWHVVWYAYIDILMLEACISCHVYHGWYRKPCFIIPSGGEHCPFASSSSPMFP